MTTTRTVVDVAAAAVAIDDHDDVAPQQFHAVADAVFHGDQDVIIATQSFYQRS